MHQVSLEFLCVELRRICKETGSFIRLEQEKLNIQEIESKGLNDFVTSVDKRSEEMLVSKLSVLLPDSGFLTEEKTVAQERKSYTWIIDPIDGTTNFIHGLPLYCISVALQYQSKTVVAVVYEISRDECFWAYEGSGTFLNEKLVRVTNTNALADSLLVTGFPYRDQGMLDSWMEIFKTLLYRTHGIRRLGSAAIDLAWVACGRMEAFYEYGLSPWDVAAGAFLVEQAGGRVSDYAGGDDFITGKELLASNGAIHEELREVIKSYFVKN